MLILLNTIQDIITNYYWNSCSSSAHLSSHSSLIFCMSPRMLTIRFSYASFCSRSYFFSISCSFVVRSVVSLISASFVFMLFFFPLTFSSLLEISLVLSSIAVSAFFFTINSSNQKCYFNFPLNMYSIVCYALLMSVPLQLIFSAFLFLRKVRYFLCWFHPLSAKHLTALSPSTRSLLH